MEGAQNRILRTIIAEKNDVISRYKADLSTVKDKLAETTEELEVVKVQNERQQQAKANEISELKETSSLLETTRELAVNTLHKKQKAFERRKNHCAAIQTALSASQSQVAELKVENGALRLQVLSFQGIAQKLDSQMQENASLRDQVRVLNEKVAEMKTEEENKAAGNEEKRKLLLEKVRQFKDGKLKEVLNLKNEVETVRGMCETTLLAESQEKKELQEKLETEQKSHEITEEKLESEKRSHANTEEKLTSCKLKLEQQNKCMQNTVEEFAKQNCIINEKNLEIGLLKQQNEKLQKFILGAQNAVGQVQGYFGNVVQSNFFQGENVIENDVNDDDNDSDDDCQVVSVIQK